MTYYRMLLLFLILLLNSCALSPKIMNVSDFQGNWESIGIGYYVLSINDSGEGYLVGVNENDRIDTLKFTELKIDGSQFYFTFIDPDNENVKTKMTGSLINENQMFIGEAKESDRKKNEIWFFLRESIVPILRNKAKEKASILLKRDT